MTPLDFRNVLNRLVDNRHTTIAMLCELLKVSRSSVNSWMGRAGKSSALIRPHLLPSMSDTLSNAFGTSVLTQYVIPPTVIMIKHLRVRREELYTQQRLLNDELDRLNNLIDAYESYYDEEGKVYVCGSKLPNIEGI